MQFLKLNNMFEVKNLKINTKDKNVVEDASFYIDSGKSILIIGANGSGKSSLLNGIFHHPEYSIESGNIFLNNKEITNLKTDELARNGLHLFMQHIPEIEGVSLLSFLHYAYKTISEDNTQNILQTKEKLEKLCDELDISKEFLLRDLNKGLSGGEKKQVELLHILLLSPKIVFMDEADSGADIETVKKIVKVIEEGKKKDISFVIISHLQNIEKEISFDKVYEMRDKKLYGRN